MPDAPDETSAQCQKGRHASCGRPMACDCECHDEPGKAAMWCERDDGTWACLFPLCGREDFGSEQAVRVHYGRTHGPAPARVAWVRVDEPEPVTLSGSAAADLGESEPNVADPKWPSPLSRFGTPIHVELKFDLPLSDQARTALTAMLNGLLSS